MNREENTGSFFEKLFNKVCRDGLFMEAFLRRHSKNKKLTQRKSAKSWEREMLKKVSSSRFQNQARRQLKIIEIGLE